MKKASVKLSKTGSQEDYRLSAVGYNLGQALSKGHLTPDETYKLIDTMLRTDRYNVISEHNLWLQLLPKKE